MRKAGLPVCKYRGSKCNIIWLDAEGREQSNDTKIVFTPLTMQMLLTLSVQELSVNRL